MELRYAAVLGVIQGLTEFLPVSSSGHLVLFQNLFGFTEPEIFFDVSLHVGTLIAICVFFFKDLKELFSALFSRATWRRKDVGLWESLCRQKETRFLGLIFVGTIPTVIIGLIIRPVAERLFSSLLVVGGMLLLTGLILWLTRRVSKEGRDETQLTIRDALCIGAIQGAAILPGLSRSGATIAMGLFAGLGRETAARYSFLLSIPAIMGAMVLELHAGLAAGFPPVKTVLVGVAVAAVVGYVALSVLIRLVKKGNLYAFAPYCWLLGLSAIVRSL
jgi:undecaprenyl-diphosphatase